MALKATSGAHRNYVEVTGGTMDEVTGAQAGSGSLTDNFVSIQGEEAIVSGIVSGARVNGTGSVSNNVVSIRAGAIGGTLFGGYAQRGDAIGNIVEVADSVSIGGHIYGGYASSGGNATDNRVILSGSVGLSNSILYGGYAPQGLSTGNVLEIHTSNLVAGNLKDFQELHFILPADVSADAAVLTLSGKQMPTREDRDPAPVATDLQGVKVGVAIQGGGNVLKHGDRITLVHNPIGLLTDSTIAEADVSGYQGISLEYQFGLSADAYNLIATARHGEGGGAATVLEQTKAPVEGQASTLALGVQGADLAAGAGLSQALAATTGGSGVSTFGAASGGRSRYKSGSHVDVNGFSLMVGAAKRIDRQAGQVLAGAFVEGGWGRFDTHNTFSTGYVRGDGKSHYVGGGVLLRHDWTPGKHGNLYAEGSMRVGRISSDWHSQDMVGSANAAYDVSALYYGAHLGAGQVWPLNAYASVDVSAKYFWTHQKGDSATIAGDPYTFKAVDSHRTRLGARLNLASARHTTSYVGAYWEREFDGQARATVYGLETPAPSLKGNTGVFEVGFNWSPDAKKALTVGVGAQGYVGMRKGVSGTARMQWIF